MAALAPKKDKGHPWWECAKAVESMIDSGEFPEAVEYLKGVYENE